MKKRIIAVISMISVIFTGCLFLCGCGNAYSVNGEDIIELKNNEHDVATESDSAEDDNAGTDFEKDKSGNNQDESGSNQNKSGDGILNSAEHKVIEAGDDEDSQLIVVYVCGQVNKPGVYKINRESRIIDAITIAGGYTEDACDSFLNLAGSLSDEEKIYVPSVAEIEESDISAMNMAGTGSGSGSGGGKGSSETSSAGAIININTASKEELMTLPGIGESKAEKIISYREENGSFSSPEGIMQISGIKDGLYNKIKDRISAK